MATIKPILTGIDGLYTNADRLNEIFDLFETEMQIRLEVQSAKYGIVSGLEVSDTSNGGVEVTVTSGLAYDPQYRTTLLSADTTITGLTSADDGKYIIAYRNETTGATAIDPLTLVTAATQLSYSAIVSAIASGAYDSDNHVILSTIDTVVTATPAVTFKASSRETFLNAAQMPTVTVGLTGADADFTGSNEVPFQEALDSLVSGGGTIYVFPGDYAFSNDVNVTGMTDVRFVGEGSSSNINVSGGNFNVSGLSSLTFDSIKLENDVASGAAIDLDDLDLFSMRNTLVSGSSDSYVIKIDGPVGTVFVTDCIFENAATGLSYCVAMNTASQYAVENMLWRRNTHDKFNFYYSDEIKNVVFINCHSTGMKFSVRDLTNGTGAAYPESMIVSENFFTDTSGGFQDVRVANGVFSNNYISGGSVYSVGVNGLVANNFVVDAFGFLSAATGYLAIGNIVSGGEGLSVSGEMIVDKSILLNTASGIENLGLAWGNTLADNTTNVQIP